MRDPLLRIRIFFWAFFSTALLFLGPSSLAAWDGPSGQLTVEEAVRIALEKNPNLKAMEQRIQAQMHRARATYLSMWAKLSTGYTYTEMQDAPFARLKGIPGVDKVPFGKDRDVQWYVQLSQPIFTGFTLSTRSTLEALGIDLKRLERDKGALDIRFEVKKAYFECLMAKKGVEVAEEEVKALKSHLRDAQNLYDQGFIALNDLLRSKVALSAAIQRKVKAESALSLKKAYLNILLDQDIETPITLKDVSSIPKVDLGLEGLLRIAEAERPELKALALTIKQARLNIRLKKSTYYPWVDLVGRYEQNGDDLIARRNDFRNSHNAMLILQATWTPFEWGRKGHEVKEAVHQFLAAQDQLRALRNKVCLEVKEAAKGIEVARKNLDTARDALKEARENYRLTDLQYKEQMATSTDVLDARKFLTEAEHNLFSAIYGYHVALASLERAIGRSPWKDRGKGGPGISTGISRIDEQ